MVTFLVKKLVTWLNLCKFHSFEFSIALGADSFVTDWKSNHFTIVN